LSIRKSTTQAPATRAPIKIAIPVRAVAPASFDDVDEEFDDALPIVDDAGVQVQGSENGNVVEIDEDGRVFCFDVGTFAYPEDCSKFVRCARENSALRGWVQSCPTLLSFDPVGGLCNWGNPSRCIPL